ncbi:MAG: Fe-only nitrogenase accessory protein AnfO [Bacteroidetes bacterium]|nr:Fe-only nitrogenase accessory protein AnfO [Bacteroidota bacterium]
MKNKIAAFVDENGNALPINSTGYIHVYEIRDANWFCIDQFPFGVAGETSIAEIRKRIHEVADRLEGCAALIVNQSKGIFNSIFEEELRLRIFLATGNPIAVLFQVRDIIRTQIIQAIERIENRKTGNEYIVPVVIGEQPEGCFQIDLLKIQEKNEKIDSKEIILAFLQNERFLELEIVSLEQPQWVHLELPDPQFETNTEYRKDGLCHTFVRPKHRASE